MRVPDAVESTNSRRGADTYTRTCAVQHLQAWIQSTRHGIPIRLAAWYDQSAPSMGTGFAEEARRTSRTTIMISSEGPRERDKAHWYRESSRGNVLGKVVLVSLERGT
jgi:hypothetical protein